MNFLSFIFGGLLVIFNDVITLNLWELKCVIVFDKKNLPRLRFRILILKPHLSVSLLATYCGLQ